MSASSASTQVAPSSSANYGFDAETYSILQRVFREIDANNDGKISLAEFKDALHKHGILASNEQLVSFFNSIAHDQDRQISWAAFCDSFHSTLSELQAKGDERGRIVEPSASKEEETKRIYDAWLFKLSSFQKVHTDESWKYLLSGGISGAVSRTCTAPIERIKLLQQVEGIKDLSSNKAIAPGSVSGLQQYPGLWKSLVKIQREEGFRGHFKGNFTNVIRAAPSAAVRFTSFEFFKAQLVKRAGREQLKDYENLAAGAGAGLVSTVATYPLDLLRSRLAVQTVNVKYTGLANAFAVVWKEEGLRGFFKGVGTSAYGAVPYVALNFAMYEWLKRHFMSRGEARPSQLVSLSAGGLSGSLAMTMTYSFELIRRRMMIQGVDGLPQRYKSTLHAFATIFREEGIRGLHRGLWANYFKVVPSMAISFWTYEMCKRFFNLS